MRYWERRKPSGSRVRASDALDDWAPVSDWVDLKPYSEPWCMDDVFIRCSASFPVAAPGVSGNGLSRASSCFELYSEVGMVLCMMMLSQRGVHECVAVSIQSNNNNG